MMKHYILAGLLMLVVQCKSQATRPGAQRLFTIPFDYEDPQENIKQEPDREVQFSRRADVRVPIRYSAENPADYPAYIRQQEQQPTDTVTENYPYQLLREIQTARYNRFRINPSNKKTAAVEQYLKEVPPTTKTTYNLRYSGQPRSNNHKQSLDVSRSVLKQSQPPFQYVLQPDFEQVSTQEERGQVIYNKPQEVRIPQNPELHASNLVAHQNVLLAEQNALYEQQQSVVHNTGIDGKESSRSAIYVSQKIPKKPIVRKPKVVPTNEDDTDYYARILEYQQQQQQQSQVRQQQQQLQQQALQQEQQVYEPKEPAPARFQARLPQATQYDAEQNQQLSKYQETVQYQQPQPLEGRYEKPAKPRHPSRQPSYQPHTSARYQEAIKYQQAHQEEQEQSSRGIKPVEEVVEQPYQQPVDNNQVGYQKVTEEALAKYRAALAKYQELVYNRDAEGTPQQQYEFQSQESAQQEYQQQPQYPEQSYQAAQEQPGKIYKAAELEQALRNRVSGASRRVPEQLNYKQSVKSSNVRYYRNSGRPSIIYTTTE